MTNTKALEVLNQFILSDESSEGQNLQELKAALIIAVNTLVGTAPEDELRSVTRILAKFLVHYNRKSMCTSFDTGKFTITIGFTADEKVAKIITDHCGGEELSNKVDEELTTLMEDLENS